MATSRAQKTPSRRGHCNRAKRITFGSGAGPRSQKVQNVVISARGRFGEGPEFRRFVWSWRGLSFILLGIGISDREASPCLICRPCNINESDIPHAERQPPCRHALCRQTVPSQVAIDMEKADTVAGNQKTRARMDGDAR
jgi:hypothetical protein